MGPAKVSLTSSGISEPSQLQDYLLGLVEEQNNLILEPLEFCTDTGFITSSLEIKEME
jgi:hypothetical protein